MRELNKPIERVGKTLAELWPDVRVGDVLGAPMPFGVDGFDEFIRISRIVHIGEGCGTVNTTGLNGETRHDRLLTPHDIWRLVANVTAADFAPRYWQPGEEPSAEACLAWLANQGELTILDLLLGDPPLAAIRAAMKSEQESSRGRTE